MADAATRSILCRYFLSNTCRDGDQCRFSHDRTTGIVDNACRYFQKGSCRYGARCRYDHVRKSPNGNKELISKGRLVKQNDVNQNPHSAGPSGSSSSARAEGKSFAESVRGAQTKEAAERARLAALPLCEYHMISGACPDKKCRAVHGDLCEICSKFIVHPHNPEFNQQHVKDCKETHEKHAELAAAIARSAKLQCGVCMDVVLDKEPELKRFGVLENCSHVFCLACIRRWRQVKNVDVKSARGCPECRTPSDFVTPSAYFVESGEEKRVLIDGYKARLATKDCKYFNFGKGTCPFANKCFYKHAMPDGTLAPDAGPPTTRRRYDSSGHLHAFDPDAMVMEMFDMLRGPLRDDMDSDFSFEYSYDYSFDNDFDYDYDDYDDLDVDDDDMSHD